MGKTTVSNMFRDLSVPVWCADQEVLKLYSETGAATNIIVKKYPSVISKRGVDKNKLRNLIHKNNEILKKIEEIVHPLLDNSKKEFMSNNETSPLVVFDIPLLFEKNQESIFDAVLVLTASEATQRKRVLKRKNITEKDFQLIKKNQLNEKEKLKRADFVINTDNSLSDTKRDVEELYNKITKSID